jgi:hypothetical protein
VYLYLMSRLVGIERNRLLMNKGADVLCVAAPPGTPQQAPPPDAPLANSKDRLYPAKWWGHEERRGVTKDENGRWGLDKRWTGQL